MLPTPPWVGPDWYPASGASRLSWAASFHRVVCGSRLKALKVSKALTPSEEMHLDHPESSKSLP